jgi:peptidoglycan/LPS O-acetylase OafA/YrhL
MRSSSDQYYLALDHLRALAALLVFGWHFLHGVHGHPIQFGYSPAVFPLALIDEGHTGVALFMTLSGYLFAKLLDGHRVRYRRFLYNRALRLLPVLAVAITLTGVQRALAGVDLRGYAATVARGLVEPTLPNGGWSITTEFHFYLLLPVLLWLVNKSKASLVIVIVLAILGRTVLYQQHGEVQGLAYFTIVGRIDQFLLGILGYHYRFLLKDRHARMAVIGIAFAMAAWYFDRGGGFVRNPSFPSTNPVWIVLPTIEGLAYAALVAYYDSSFAPENRGLSFAIGRIGAYSYSIYLFHFFVVFWMASLIDSYFGMSNFYVACIWALAGFLLMAPIGYVSYRFLETPWLAFRKPYLLPAISEASAATAYLRRE